MSGSDALLSTYDRQEAFSRAYVFAVAASVGYTTATRDYDRDSVDLTISAGGQMRPSIDVQLKATINLGRKGDLLTFPLKIKNYNELRMETQTPRIVVVLDMPESPDEWLYCDIENLILRRAAYWAYLGGSPESDNDTSVTIEIPSHQHFDAHALQSLMVRSRAGFI